MTSQLSHSQGHSDCSAYEVPVNVAWVDGSEYGYDGDLYLTKVPEGDTVMLRGSSRLIWLAAVESPDPLAEVAAAAGLPASEIAGDVSSFLAELTGKGLLVMR